MTELWDAVDRLVDRAPSLDDLKSHRIEFLAARRWRALGRPVPPELAEAERSTVVVILTAPIVLEHARGAYDGAMLLMKGPEVAARYPDAVLRPFKDLDLLVDDAERAQRAFLAAGFKAVGDPSLYRGIQHLRPLAFPGLPVFVELHSRPKWVDGLAPPPAAELFSVGTSSRLGVDGVLTLPPGHHAILLAAHAWAHEPLRQLRDVIDVAAMAQEAERVELQRVAKAWQIERVWDTTTAATEAVLFGAPRPWSVRMWARNLEKVRERTVLENHLARWLANFSALPPREATTSLGSTFLREVRPSPGETWRSKLARSARAVRNALLRRSQHAELLSRRDDGAGR
jgi:Uncharacterised nucleotidyltransferase